MRRKCGGNGGGWDAVAVNKVGTAKEKPHILPWIRKPPTG